MAAAAREIERLRADIARHIEIICAEMEENENLRAALRAVRGSTDPEWAARLITYALRETP